MCNFHELIVMLEVEIITLMCVHSAIYVPQSQVSYPPKVCHVYRECMHTAYLSMLKTLRLMTFTQISHLP